MDQSDQNLSERDHKRLGKELDLFTFSDTVGKGLPLWTPKGATIRRELERWVVDEELKMGYQHVYTPELAKLALYEKSGHYPYYKESMYAPIMIEEEKFMLRPMTCPHHFELYLSRPHSYKELPIRYAELAKLFRFEKSGELMGLQRVRSFCLADAHIMAREDQAQNEIGLALDLIDKLSKILGLKYGKDNRPGNYFYRLSLGDRQDTKKYYQDDKAWDKAEEILRQVLKQRKVEFVEAPGEAAFYGPKIDIQMFNANGKEDTAFTVQYDFVMPKRFTLNYVNEEGKEEQAIVIHRSSIGAIERVIAFLIEFYGGAFPAWLAPVQAEILPIADRHREYSKKIEEELKEAGIRAELDDRSEKLGAKIRDAQRQKIPYMLVVGDKEAENLTVAVRSRSGRDYGSFPVQKFIENLKKEIQTKSLKEDLVENPSQKR